MFVSCYADQDSLQCKDYFEQVDRGPSTAHFIKTLNVSSLIHSLSRLILIESILWFCPLKGHPDYNAAFSKKKNKKQKTKKTKQKKRKDNKIKNKQSLLWKTGPRGPHLHWEIQIRRAWTWTIGCFYLPHIFSVPYCTFNSKQPNSFNILFSALNWNREEVRFKRCH